MFNFNSLKVHLPVFFLGIFCATTGLADDDAELAAMRAELEALKAGQAEIQKDIREIVALLEKGAQAPRPGQQGFKPRDLRLGSAPFIGDANATVTVVEFSDYQCPYCKRHATTVMPDLLKQYADSGQAKFVMREFPIENLHPRAVAASQAALCAKDQGHYWQMHDLLFADQRAMGDEQLKAHAATLGLDQSAFDACYDDNQHIARIRDYQKEAAQMGITGTPSFVLGITDPDDPGKVRLTRFIRGAQSLATFQATIDELLEEASDES